MDTKGFDFILPLYNHTFMQLINMVVAVLYCEGVLVQLNKHASPTFPYFIS